MRKVFITIFSFAIFLNLKAQSPTDSLRYELYLTKIAAAEALLQLNKINEASEILHSCEATFRNIEWYFLEKNLNQSQASYSDGNLIYADIKRSPDGGSLAAASSDSTIVFFNSKTEKRKNILRGAHKGSVTTVAFSPDGKLLASGGRDNTVTISEWETGKIIRKIDTAFSRGIYQVCFSDDGTKLGVVTWELLPHLNPSVYGFAKIIDVQTGKILTKINLDNHPAAGLVFCNQDKAVIFSTWGEVVYKYSLETGALVWQYDLSDPSEYNAFYAVDISKDGKTIAVGSADHRIHFLDVETGKVIRKIEPWQGHTKVVKAVRYSPDGKWLASAGDDQSILIWNTADYSQTFKLIGHTATVNALEWSTDSKELWSVAADKTRKKWALSETFKTEYTICNFGPWQVPVHNQVFAAPCSDEKLVIYASKTGKLIQELSKDKALSAAFSKDGERLVTGGFDKKVKLWNLKNNVLIQTFEGHTSRVDGVAYLNKTKQAISVADKTLRVWSVGTDSAVVKKNLTESPFRINVSPDETMAVISYNSGKIGVYTTKDWQEITTFRAESAIQEMAFSPDSRFFAVFSGKNIEIFDLDKKMRKHKFVGHQQMGYGVSFSNDGKYLITGSNDQTFKLWNLETGKCTLTYHGFEDTIYSAQFISKNGLLLGTSQGVMRYYAFD